MNKIAVWNIPFIKIIFAFGQIPLILTSCSAIQQFQVKDTISITNWNVQTFFDANNDGIEYSEFNSSKSKWNLERYESRLDKLCELIEKIDSDVFVMEELENEKIIYDISNRLSHKVWNPQKVYSYAAFQKDEGSSIGCGVLSRVAITGVRYHSIDIRTEDEDEPSMRPIMELTLGVDEDSVHMFVNHWKSKSGDESGTAKWRRWQECLLSDLCFAENRETSDLFFAVGDFNQDISEFSRDDLSQIYFTCFDREMNKKLEMFSPWDETETEIGSYFFSGDWERIDHFFCTSPNKIENFQVVTYPELLTEEGIPDKYKISPNTGYSDHLPITCQLRIN